MKKLWFNLIIFCGCFLLLVTTLGTVLILAPGMELLGVMYIRSTSGAIYESKSVTEATGYDEIVVKSDNIPITIEFVQSFLLTANMVEEYNGFAKAGETPTLDVEATSSAININSNEYESFFAYSRSQNSGLVVKVPIYYAKNLVIESRRSNITFLGLGSTLTDVKIKTKGSVLFQNDLVVKNLELNIGNKDAIVGDEVNIDGYLLINSGRGDVFIPDGFTGNVYFKSDSGDINLASCGSLKVESKTGDVNANNNKLPKIIHGADIKTNGNVTLHSVGDKAVIKSGNGDLTIGETEVEHINEYDIETRSGNVTLLGNYLNKDSKIKTTSGDVSIENCISTDIVTKYGNVSISNSTNNTIQTKSGDVNISNLFGIHNITTNNGNVILGEKSKTNNVSEASVTTIGGDVSIYNATGGVYNIKTTTGDIEFVQDKDKVVELTVCSNRGDINLQGINGTTTVITKGAVTANIARVNGKVTIEGKNRRVNVVVEDNCYFDLKSKKNIEMAPGLNGKSKIFNTVPESSNLEDRTLQITTKRGKIAVSKI